MNFNHPLSSSSSLSLSTTNTSSIHSIPLPPLSSLIDKFKIVFIADNDEYRKELFHIGKKTELHLTLKVILFNFFFIFFSFLAKNKFFL